MKNLKLLLALFIMSFVLFSCSDDDDDTIIVTDPVEEMNLNLLKSIENDGHTVELYSKKQALYVGYNEIYIRIKDASDDYIEDFDVSAWMPKMHMTMHTHACPFSDIEDTDHNTLKKGYIVFTMASNDTEYWELTMNYTIGSQPYSIAEEVINVTMENNRRKVMNFMGSDDTMYIVAYVSPENPEVAVNDSELLLFKKESMMSFPLVEDYTITLDPRMPSMGNHSSPNNEDYTYNADEEIYEGKVSLTMTGYWKLNLKVLDEDNNIMGGSDITDTNESSDVYLEIEF